jgi:regulator of nucleoside diphosphate kinase
MLKSLFSSRRIVSESDYKSINSLILNCEEKHPLSTNFPFLKFKAEMKIAKKYQDWKLPLEVVKLNSKLTIRNIKTGIILPVKIVCPLEEELNKYKLSVFSAVGMALFGNKTGKTINCFEGERKIHLEILSIV